MHGAARVGSVLMAGLLLRRAAVPRSHGCLWAAAPPPTLLRATARHMSFNVFDLLPDLDALRKKRAKRLEDAVGRGKVRGGFVSGFEHLTRPVKGAARTGSDTPLPQEAYRPQSGGGSGSPPPGDCPDPSQEPPPPPRASSLLAPPELTLRCTELDINGSITVRAGEFQKSELCAQHGLQARDLRKIDSKFVNQMPAILVRKHAILVNLLHIRALIEADRIVLFDSIGAPGNYSQSTLIFELQARLRSGSRAPGAPATDADSAQPFEFRALEAVLVSVVTTLQSDEEVLVNLVQSLLAYLEESVDRSKLRELLQYSKRLSRFEQKVLNIRDAVEEVLEQDEDLAGMYLTQKLRGPHRRTTDHEEVELMMETYLKQVEEIVNHVQSVSSHVRTTEDVVNIILDSQRNSLLLLEIRLTILTVGLSSGTFLSGLFGMNLVSSLEAHPNAFAAVAGFALATIMALTFVGLRAMRKVLRKIN